MFQGILISKDDAAYRATVQAIGEEVLPDGDVTVRVGWSTLNYKDGLAITGRAPVVRRFPMIPGIDFAGTVVDSRHAAWKVGDRVLLNGWGVGETHCGGLAEMARVKGDWLIALPAEFSARQAMAIGTAGYRDAVRDGARKARRQAGRRRGAGHRRQRRRGQRGDRAPVAARVWWWRPRSHGRIGLPDRTRRDNGDRPQRTVGTGQAAGQGTLGRSDRYGRQPHAGQCLCDDPLRRRGGGLRAGRGMDFPSSVAPFILRGVTLCGIDSVMAPLAVRQAAWGRLARDLDLAKLDAMTREVALAERPPWPNSSSPGRCAVGWWSG
jgi:acrylyl-CoA reductase (NADPH)